MNKKMKNIFTLLLVGAFSVPAFAADVSDRADCTKIQSRISELAAIENPDEAQSAELTQLQTQYRANCSKPASGRRISATARVSTATATATTNVTPEPIVETVIITTQSVLKDYLSERQKLCNEFNTDIATLTSNGASEAELKPLQNQYDKDCKDIDKSAIVEIDAETAAANVAAGLCTDGSKPNQFGCCEGETFKDIGNLVFACCPDDGGECYPPINSGDAI